MLTMTYEEFTSAPTMTDVAVEEKTGLSRYHLSRIRNGHRPLTRAAAVRIWAAFKVKLDPISDLSDTDLRALAKLEAAQ